MNLVRGRWLDTRHRLMCSLGTIPQNDSRFDEPALLRRAELFNHLVETRLPLLAVVAIDGHGLSLRAEFALVGGARLVRGRSPAFGVRHGLCGQASRRFLLIEA